MTMTDATPKGLCQCGCGQRAPIATSTCHSRGHVRGQPLRFINHHNARAGKHHPAWKTGKSLDPSGYVMVRLGGSRRKTEHILVAERAMGKSLPKGAQVHHVNGVRSDNRNANLVVCQDQAYHALLHVRTAALAACGHASWRKCTHCKQYDAPQRLSILSSGAVYHKACRARAAAERRVA